MSKKIKINLPSIVVTVITSLFVVGVLVVYASWTPAPAGTPPNCPAGQPGCDAPVNVGVTGQTKSGALVVGSLGVNGPFQAFSDAVFSGNLTLGGVVKSTNSIYVCRIGQAPPCLGRYLGTTGTTIATLTYLYNDSNNNVASQLVYGAGNSCPLNYTLVARSPSGLSLYTSLACGGTEYAFTSPPYGLSGLVCESTNTVPNSICSSKGSSGLCTADSRCPTRQGLHTIIAAPGGIVPLYELR